MVNQDVNGICFAVSNGNITVKSWNDEKYYSKFQDALPARRASN